MRLLFYNYITVATILILISTTTAIAASLTVVPSTGSTFTVQGTGLGNVGGMELSISYDGSSLAPPKVTVGSLISGTLFATNTNTPGSIKVAIIATTAISGNGPVVVINFVSKTETVRILSFKASMIDSKGIQIPVQSSISTGTNNIGSDFISTPGVPFSQPPTPNAATTISTPPIASTTTISIPPTPNAIPEKDTAFTTILGTMPATSEPLTEGDAKPHETKSTESQDISDQVFKYAQPNERPQEAKTVKQPNAERLTSDPEKSEKEKVTTISYTGILENLREYKEVKTPASLIALFNKEITPAIRQEPAIALSNGKALVNIIIKSGVAGDKSPNFALNGAKLVSLNKDASSAWIIKALPLEGAVQASLTIMTDSNTIEYPLTLAPPIESISASMADFVVFLSDSGTASPKYDFNKDKKHDYLDDFIYTANYILKTNTSEKANK